MRLVLDGNVSRLGPVGGRVMRDLQAVLRYERRNSHHTYEQRLASGGKPVSFTTVDCFATTQLNGKPYLVFSTGYLPLVNRVLRSYRVQPKVLRVGHCGRPEALVPRLEVLDEYDLRWGQREVIEQLIKLPRGQVKWPTGTGKSVLIELLCRVFNKARIAVVTKHQDPLRDLHRRLSNAIRRTGMIYSKKKTHSDRLTCYSIGCLDYAHQFPPPDIVIADEGHELATDEGLPKLARFKNSRMYLFSASAGDRFDNADFELEGLFGRVVVDLPYSQAVERGLIVPIEVHWRTVMQKPNPVACYEQAVARVRHGIWRNDYRNWLISRDARRFPDDQVLITVSTTDHAVHLLKYLPDFTLCYTSMDSVESYISRGLLPEGYQPLTGEERLEIKHQFETGKLRKVIATPVWKRGVNFTQLGVLIRADGSSSMVDDTQIPGRLSRTCEKTGKRCGILIDYLDQFDRGFQQRAGRRRTHYREHGWRQLMPGDPEHVVSVRGLTA